MNLCADEPALHAPALAPGAPSTDPAALCGWGRLALAGRAGITSPDTGIARTLSLPRAHLDGGLALGDLAGARVALAVVRSGGDGGYIGVDGEALVPEVQIAEARGAWRPWGVAVGAGVVDDPWVRSGDEAWGLREVAPGFGEAMGWMDSSDVGGWVGWTAPRRLVSVRVDLSSGEGARYRERNEGKDVAGTVTARPLGTDALVVTAYARDGSRGLGLARDHRVGGRLSTGVGPVVGGAELLAAWGVDGDAERAPLGGSAWVVARPWGPLLAFGRLDVTSEALDDPDASTRVYLAGVGVALPDRERHPLQVIVGYEGTRAGSAVAPIAGADALEDADEVYLQLGVSLGTAPP